MKNNYISCWSGKLCLLTIMLLCIQGLQAQEFKQIKGKVFDAQSGELLVGVSIYTPEQQAGTTTNGAGSFDMFCPIEDDSIIVSYLGYQQRKICVCAVHREEAYNIDLRPVVQNLQPMVITASRDRQERTAAPVAISALTAQQIKEAGPTVLSEVMNKVLGVLMVNLGNEQHSMSIRQPMSYRGYFLYLEDGIPIRPAGLFNHNALIEINMFGLRGIEVLRGPASSIYGSEAIGGAVNFLTLTPRAMPGFELGIHADQWGYKRIQFNGGGFVTKKLGLAGGGYLARQTDGWQGHSDFDKLSLNLRADYFLNDKAKLVATISRSALDTETGGSLDSTGFYTRTYNTLHSFTYRKVNALRARIGMEYYGSEGSGGSINLFFRNNKIDQLPAYAIRNSRTDKLLAAGEENTASFQSYGITAQHKQTLPWGGAKLLSGFYLDYSPSQYKAHYIVAGREEGSGRYISYTARQDSLLSLYNADLLNTALYTQAEINPVPELKLVAGVRYDRLDYFYDNHLTASAFSGAPDEHNSFTFFTPKLGLTYSLYKSTGLYGNISKGAYAPGINELYRGVKVPSLQHAQFTNYEAGFWTGQLENKLYLEACVYAMKGRNEIVSYVMDDGRTENRNSGETLHKGVEYTLTYAPAKPLLFRFGGTNAAHTFISYKTKEEQDYSGNKMPNAPAWLANAEISWKPSFLPGYRAGLEWQRVSSWFTDEANLNRYADQTLMGLKGVSMLNFRTAYAWKGMEAYLHIMNLTNELYASNVTKNQWGNVYNPAAARTFTFGLSCRFSAKE